MQYELTMRIDPQALRRIHEMDMGLTLVKSVVSSLPAHLPVAWVQFQPLEVNQVTWTEACSIYATETPLQPGETIVQISEAPAQPGWVYIFNEGGLEGEPANLGEVCKVVNGRQGPFAFGLAQQATIGGNPMLAPLNAVTVPFNETVNFTPKETVSICLAPLTSNGVVLSRVPGNALTLSLTAQAPTAVIGFNDESNTFYLISRGE
ncbi:hypothetical protein [Bradyrhizobium prioriisuperbiae]|uniref:hypothetical protein n=1 Tax=Bradyrhizobium prioriisuperbiae TaxID=2854389 RepID=UPI0028EE01DE|nr:hypothetical protein [Bradyrhizobium prioritasuperba]